MFDDILKALTIQITADDLTAGAWSSVTDGIKEASKYTTALNQAWELGEKIFNKAAQALAAPIKILTAGGEFAEAEAGLAALGKSYKINSDAMVQDIRSITEGNLTLQQAVQSSSEAIKKGYSPEQTRTIFEFAQKYTDVMGGDVLAVANSITEAIYTGKGKAVKPFGLDVQEGMAVVDIMRQLQTQTQKMGEGVFNFGDSWKEATQSISDAGIEIKKALNDLVGEMGFGQIADQFKEAMRALENEAPTIAAGIFVPLTDAAKMAWSPIEPIFSEVSGWLGTTFDNTDTLGIKINTIIGMVGNTFYDFTRNVAQAFSWLISPIELALQGIGKTVTTIELAVISVAEDTGAFSAERIAQMKLDVATIEQLAADGFLAFDTSGIDAKQKAFNETLLKTGQAHGDLRLKVQESVAGISKAGEAFGALSKKEKASAKQLQKISEEISDFENRKADAQKGLQRKIEDAEREHQERLRDIIAKGGDTRKKIQEENERFEEKEKDARRNFSQKIEDIVEDHNKKMTALGGDTASAMGTHNESIAKMSDAYTNMGKEFQATSKDVADGVKAIGDVVEEEQKGINKTAGMLADLYSTGGGGGFKAFDLERLMDRQEREKARDRGLLEKQVDAQSRLAKAMEYAATHPKIVEFNAPNDPNILEAFISYTIDFLTNEARTEGTPVQA